MSIERDPVADRIAGFLDRLITKDVPRTAPTQPVRRRKRRAFREYCHDEDSRAVDGQGTGREGSKSR